MKIETEWISSPDGAYAVVRLLEAVGVKWDRNSVREFLETFGSFVVGGYVDSEPAGFARCHELPRLDAKDHQMFIYEKETAPAHRRKGVATAILRDLRVYCAATQFSGMFLISNESNRAAVALYEKTGGARLDPVGDAAVWTWPLYKTELRITRHGSLVSAAYVREDGTVDRELSGPMPPSELFLHLQKQGVHPRDAADALSQANVEWQTGR